VTGRRALAPMNDPFEAYKVSAFDQGPEAALVLDRDGAIVAVNEAGEALFGQGLTLLSRARFRTALPPGSPLEALIDGCVAQSALLRERGVTVHVFGAAPFVADVSATPLGAGAVLLTLRARSASLAAERASEIAGLHSVVGFGRMLAHEIKNPLAGIRGAAQLLKSGLGAADIPLAQLIVEETERIRRLVDRMEAFSDDADPVRTPINIYRVLDRVRALAANGVADGIVIREAYDPSLPPALGEEDQLIQVFLNLVKNAAEAAHARGDGRGEITIATAYRHGVRVKSGRAPAQSAPLEVKVTDNGPGVPEHLRDHLFEPFVTSKAHGTGLGLALVVKIVAGHGGLVDFESEPGRTVFRVLLPAAPERRAEGTPTT